MDAHMLQELNRMKEILMGIRQPESQKPAGHNRVDEDMAKVATAERIGKTKEGETLKK